MSDQPEIPEKPGAPLNTVYRLFFIPLLIVIVSVGLFYLFGRMTIQTKKADDFLYEIKTGGESKKWQAAYGLAGMLITEKNIPENTKKEYTREIISIFQNKDRYNVRVRGYLALALGYLKQKESVPVLIEALNGSEEDIVLYSVWALAVIGDPSAVKTILPLLEDRRPAIRKISAFALGTFGDQSVAGPLKKLLNDPVPDISWNAALSLAELGDSSGAPVLLKLLDRNYLNSFPRLSEREKEGVLVNVIKSVGRLKLEETRGKLEELASKDPSLKVRQAAMEAKG